MKLIIDFYHELDTINLILFWGIIIVIFLLLIFSIIIANKNKKLKKIILSEQLENNILKEEISIPIKNPNTKIIKEEEPVAKDNETPKIEITNNNIMPEKTVTIPEEKKFIAEEHIINYNQNKTEIKKEEPNKPYQRNILREMSLSQTSPIGIAKKENQGTIEIRKAEELNKNLSQEEQINIEKEPIINIPKKEMPKEKIVENIESETKKEESINDYPKENNKIINNHQEENIRKMSKFDYFGMNNKENNNFEKKESIVAPQESNKQEYLEEVSSKLSQANEYYDIDRTAYEIQQEEEAIISYEELMQKKDSIQIVDEEEAIISIEELINKKKQEEKIYQITEKETNNKFISELKDFRNDL